MFNRVLRAVGLVFFVASALFSQPVGAARLNCLVYLAKFALREQPIAVSQSQIAEKRQKLKNTSLSVVFDALSRGARRGGGDAALIEQAASEIVPSWIAILYENGLDQLADLAQSPQLKIFAKTSPTNGRNIYWRARVMRLESQYALHIALPTQTARTARTNHLEAFWQFVESLHEIYFYRSLWSLGQEFWNTERVKMFPRINLYENEGVLDYLIAVAGQNKSAYLQKIKAFEPNLYSLFEKVNAISESPILLSEKDVPGPSWLRSVFRYWQNPIYHVLNQQDRVALSEDWEKYDQQLEARLGRRVAASYFTNLIRRYIVVAMLIGGASEAVMLPQQLYAATLWMSPFTTTMREMNSNPERYDNAFMLNLKDIYRTLNDRITELEKRTSLTSKEAAELKDALGEKTALDLQYPQLMGKAR